MQTQHWCYNTRLLFSVSNEYLKPSQREFYKSENGETLTPYIQAASEHSVPAEPEIFLCSF